MISFPLVRKVSFGAEIFMVGEYSVYFAVSSGKQRLMTRITDLRRERALAANPASK